MLVCRHSCKKTGLAGGDGGNTIQQERRQRPLAEVFGDTTYDSTT